MITLFAALSAEAKTYLRCNFSIFFFGDLTERLGGCLYKCGCLVKLSILMSMMRINSFFQSLRACTPTPSFLDQRLQYVSSASSTISRHLVKSILDGSLYLGPLLKSERNPLSGIQVRSPVTTCPAGGHRKGESAQDHDRWMELRTSGSEANRLQLKTTYPIGFLHWQQTRGGSRLQKHQGTLEMTIWSLKMLETPSKPKPRSTNLILINCVLGGSVGMWGKSLLNEKAIIILSLNQSECLKLLRSASSMWWSCHVISNTSTHAAFIAVFHRPEQSSTGGYKRITGCHWTYRHSMSRDM